MPSTFNITVAHGHCMLVSSSGGADTTGGSELDTLTRSMMAPARRPNILFICTDQQRYDSLGCNGNTTARTPNLDALAASGARFENHIVANPVCMPSRSSMLTGRFPNAHRVWTNGIALPPTETTLPAVLGHHGYRTASIGKIHLTPTLCYPGPGMMESRRGWANGSLDGWNGPYYGFDDVQLTVGHGDNALKWGHYGADVRARFPELVERVRQRESTASEVDTRESVIPLEAHHTTWIGDRTVEFIMARRAQGEPFMLFTSFPDPHHPFHVPEPYASMFDPRDIPLPMPDDNRDCKPHHYGGGRVIEARTTSVLGEDDLRRIIARTYGMIALIDDTVGRIMLALENTGLADETIVVFTSDHGELLGDHGLLLKGPYPCRSLLRVNCLMRAPGIAAPGTVVHNPTSNTDLLPTLLGLCGIDVPSGVQGRSLVDALQGGPSPDSALSMGWSKESGNRHVHQTMYTPNWRVTWFPRTGEGELYNLADDPGEKYNLFDEPDHAKIRDQLLIELYKQYAGVEEPEQTGIMSEH